MRLLIAFSVLLVSLSHAPAAEPAPTVDFAREVFPILQKACFDCHGPQKQKGELRLDSRAAFAKGGENGPVVTPGKPDASELLARVSRAKGSDGVMPSRGDTLTPAQVDVLRTWIAAGAKWPEAAGPANHWAYVKPVRPALPESRNPIDFFIRTRLEREGMKPAREAARELLIRRVSFDLIGLPPTPQEVDAFVRDSAPDAYEKLVDRLLASPQFGVRWARPWLDYARYADSHGFQRDDLRDLWAYRDWVVDALNADMPFDRFTVEQLAGDLLPDATKAQRIATGFNRSAPTNVEAGTDPEETRVNQVFDRVNTVGMVWLGSTLECAQCHDHKYDPITQKDYYGLFAFFNNTALEADRSNPKVVSSIRFLGPQMELADAASGQRAKVAARVKETKERLAARIAELGKPDPKWEAEVSRLAAAAPREHVLAVTGFGTLSDAAYEVLKDGSVLLSGRVPDKDTYTVTAKTNLTGIRAFKLETLTDPSLPGQGPGRGDATRPNFVLNTFALTAAPVTGGKVMPVPFAKATADFSQAKFDVGGAIDNDPKTAWAIGPKLHQPHWAAFDCQEPVGFESGTVLTFKLVQNFGSGRTIGRLRLSAITGGTTGEALPDAVAKTLKIPAEKRVPARVKILADYRAKTDPDAKKLAAEVARLEAEARKIAVPTTLVMEEQATPRASMVFQRGDFRTPGAALGPATPKVLHALKRPGPAGPGRSPPNRLDLARWLVSPENPLAARVTVNRWWAELFGHGLVATPEDFGIKGEPPTHPELLDWLACEFMRPTSPPSSQAWSMKHVLRLMVLSATYRQSSRATPEALARDDRNLFYARGPRRRLDAEAIRDNALAIAGLLSLKQGGPPIHPYQPDGLWNKVGGAKTEYVVSNLEDRYRRGLYVVWKRGAPYPSFVNFDANARLACRVQRSQSNTPLQALTLLNDPVYVEAAMAFARRVLIESPAADDDARLRHAFRIAVARSPRVEELVVLQSLLKEQRESAAADPAKVKQMLSGFEVPKAANAAEFAAWYAVCAALLNLDETITKG